MQKMNIKSRFYVPALILLVAACSSVTVGPVMKQLKETPPIVKDYKEARDLQLDTQDYAKWLQKDYKAIALFENDEMFDYDSAEHFARKSFAAGEGKILKPDAPSSRKVNAPYQAEAEQMYNITQEAYSLGKNYRFPKDMARLQVSYDCWLEQVEEDIQPNHIMKCKELFYEALANMKEAPVVVEPPQPVLVPATVVLYFENNSATLAPDQAQKLQEVVNNPTVLRNSVVIEGYADRLDSSKHNLTLSQKRADDIKAIIQSLDPGITNVSTKAFGETEPAVPTADGAAEPHNRRVVVYFN